MNQEKRNAALIRASYVSIFMNAVLVVLKLLAGIFGHSKAMVADAVHSLSDVLTTVGVIVAVKIASREADENHPYGHDKYEDLASLFLALALGATGAVLGYRSIVSMINGAYKTAAVPGAMALWAAVLSIAVKEGMYQYTIRIAKLEKSDVLKADAWHHRSDALSSVGSLVGIGAAQLGYAIADDAAGVVISVFIIKTALEILISACMKLTDTAGDSGDEKSIRRIAAQTPGVVNVDMLKTRKFGSGLYVDLEISADAGDTLKEAHEIAEEVHHSVENGVPGVKHCTVHVNPAE